MGRRDTNTQGPAGCTSVWINRCYNTRSALTNESQITPSEIAHDGTTTFVTETNVQTQNVIVSKTYAGVVPITDQSMANFLSKPYLVASGAWSTSQPTSTELFVGNVAPYLDGIPAPAIWKDKISGFGLVRGTVVLRLVVNAEPFHAGKLLLSFIPCASALTSTFWRSSLNQKTQQPSVELDCRDSTAVIKMPYIAPTEWYKRGGGGFDWGQFTISVLSVLRTGAGSSTDVFYSLFMSFEDMEFAAPLNPQSAHAPSKLKTRASGYATSVESKEADIMNNGTLSKALLLGSSLAVNAASVPLLSSIAAPASWVMRGLSHSAAWFGWSKPTIDAPQSVVSRRFIPCMANSTGASSAPKLSLIHDNALDILESPAGVPEDEMSFDYLKRRYAYCNVAVWTTDDVEGSTVYVKNMVPDACSAQITTSRPLGTFLYNSYPPFAYLAQYFQYWRGSIKVKVKLAKTDFHSGRLAFIYTPGSDTSPPIDIDSSTYCLRHVLDIRSQSEIEFVIPYLMPAPYLDRSTPMGTFTVMVLNPLKAPATVDPAIQMLFYFAGGDDFELQSPISYNNAVTFQQTLPFYPQVGGGVDPSSDQVLISSPIGNNPYPYDTMDHGRLCMGECFTSVKQLLSRYTTLASSVGVNTGTMGTVQIHPYAYGARSLSPDGGKISPSLGCDALSCFIGGYAFYRGGVKISASLATTSSAAPGIAALRPYMTFPTGPVYSSPTGDSATGAIIDPWLGTSVNNTIEAVQLYDTERFFEVECPYYCKTHMTLVNPISAGVTVPDSSNSPNYFVIMGWKTDSGKPVTLRRAASDDFQMSYFLGFPPILSGIV